MFNNSSRSIYKFNAFPFLFHLLSHFTARHLLFGHLICVYTKWRELQDWQHRCFCVENKASRVITHWVSWEWFSCLTASPVSHLPQSPLQENTLLCTQQLRRKARRVLSSPSQPLQTTDHKARVSLSKIQFSSSHIALSANAMSHCHLLPWPAGFLVSMYPLSSLPTYQPQQWASENVHIIASLPLGHALLNKHFINSRLRKAKSYGAFRVLDHRSGPTCLSSLLWHIHQFPGLS